MAPSLRSRAKYVPCSPWPEHVDDCCAQVNAFHGWTCDDYNSNRTPSSAVIRMRPSGEMEGFGEQDTETQHHMRY